LLIKKFYIGEEIIRIIKGDMLRKIILTLFILILFSIPILAETLTINHEVGRDYITIAVSGGSYSKIIEFNGPGINAKTVEFNEGVNTRKILLQSEVGIYVPGIYTFTIEPTGAEKISKEFTLELSDLKSCEFNGDYIKNNQCVPNESPKKCDDSILIDNCIDCSCSGDKICDNNETSVTLGKCVHCDVDDKVVKNSECVYSKLTEDRYKGQICVMGDIVEDCSYCNNGCPTNEICCLNENINECKNNLNKCVLPGVRVVTTNITEEVNITAANITKVDNDTKVVLPTKKIVVGGESVSGCSVSGYNIPSGLCVNNVIPMGSSDDYFSMQCDCSTLGNADADGDGFDSVDFVGGRDCDDTNPLINPLAIESCGPDVNNNNGVDENCDGVDLNCDFSCDRDEDGERDSSRWYCLGNDCNDGNANIFSGNVEICGDSLDNNCNDEVDEDCICTDGDTQVIKGIIENGIEKCVEGKRWDVVKEANMSSLIYANYNGNSYDGSVEAFVDDEIEFIVKIYCPEGGCEIEVI
jgi:hypothetical protein